MSRARGLGLALTVAVALVVIVALRQTSSSPGDDEQPDAAPTPTVGPESSTGKPTTSTPKSIKIIIGWVKAAPVRHEAPTQPYDREDFPHWRDAENYGWNKEPNTYCDSRQAALARDGRRVHANPDTCAITAGTWTDPYTGDVITDPSDLDIDHIVPLAAAYRGGADHWTKQRRTDYANNPGVLLTVSASANRSKDDQTPATWLPEDRSEWCDYGRRWATVKKRWHLAYESTREKTATVRLLTRCKGK